MQRYKEPGMGSLLAKSSLGCRDEFIIIIVIIVIITIVVKFRVM